MKQIIINRTEYYLRALTNPALSPERYGATFYSIGKEMGKLVKGHLQKANSNVKLVCTSEDADFLARGILKTLAISNIYPSITVFWHRRWSVGKVNIAPIIMRYEEPITDCDTMIVVKSIISSSCTISTQITDLFDRLTPKTTLIVAPVIYQHSIQNLMSDFPKRISDTFKIIYLREDNQLEGNIVIPGIGGDIEQRLGIQHNVNEVERIPFIVKKRIAYFRKTTE